MICLYTQIPLCMTNPHVWVVCLSLVFSNITNIIPQKPFRKESDNRMTQFHISIWGFCYKCANFIRGFDGIFDIFDSFQIAMIHAGKKFPLNKNISLERIV